ncbi:SHOCT domain-containing protein [Desulfosporosinus sp. HMP52]|uniref:SHOCT domain-containing protein n=1 Tax=Desulfosporosinus sp. HMP52 TaxID=1487923 RepID=UPI00068B31D4|nr:SHOCT domain-containing protein [Desulfosporosinus sp. HMP52]
MGFFFKSKEERFKEERTEVWKAFIKEFGIPCREGTFESNDVWEYSITAPKVDYYFGYPPIDTALERFLSQWIGFSKSFSNVNSSFYMWIEDNKIILCQDCPGNPVDDIGKHYLLLDNIVSFRVEGEMFNQLEITGGGGGGSSLSGAIIGGMLAGGAGAIIGSRKDMDSIKSTNTLLDKRITEIHYSEDDNEINIYFAGDMYDQLMGIIPNKNYNRIQEKCQSSSDLHQKLSDLKKLRNGDLITEQEYQRKKVELLNQI